MAKRSGAVGSSLYNQCLKDKNKNKEKTSGLVPRTKACYQVAEDFTTLSNHQVEVRFAAVPPRRRKDTQSTGKNRASSQRMMPPKEDLRLPPAILN